MGRFSSSRLLLKTYKIYPSAGPHEGRGKANNPVPFDYNGPIGRMQLGCLRFSGILVPRGRHVGSGCQIQQKRRFRVAGQGLPSW